MAIAVRIQKLDSNKNPIGNIDFQRYEIVDTVVEPFQPSKVQRSQKGAPTLFILGDPWHVVRIRCRIHGKSTQDKLTEIRNYIRSQGILRVYPKYYKDQTQYFDCFIQPEIAIDFLFSGEYKAGDTINLVFLETDQSSQVVVSSDVIVE